MNNSMPAGNGSVNDMKNATKRNSKRQTTRQRGTNSANGHHGKKNSIVSPELIPDILKQDIQRGVKG